MTQNEQFLLQDLVRRKKSFHQNEDPYSIKLWGLSNWGDISKLVNKGILLTDYKRENRVAWYRPAPVLLQTLLIPAIAVADFNNLESTTLEDYYNYIDNDVVINQLPKETSWKRTNIDHIERKDDALIVALSGISNDATKPSLLAMLTIRKETFDCEFISNLAKEDVVIDKMIKTMVSVTRKCVAL